MLDFQKTTNTIVATLESDKLKAKTEAYLVEVVTQKLADLFIARYGEAILADLDLEALKTQVHVHATTILTKESERVLRDD